VNKLDLSVKTTLNLISKSKFSDPPSPLGKLAAFLRNNALNSDVTVNLYIKQRRLLQNVLTEGIVKMENAESLFKV
jgi:hypothetical protein